MLFLFLTANHTVLVVFVAVVPAFVLRLFVVAFVFLVFFSFLKSKTIQMELLCIFSNSFAHVFRTSHQYVTAYKRNCMRVCNPLFVCA